jgi:hypothetical protein
MGGAEETTKEVARVARRGVRLSRPFVSGAGDGCVECAFVDSGSCDRFAS